MLNRAGPLAGLPARAGPPETAAQSGTSVTGTSASRVVAPPARVVAPPARGASGSATSRAREA